MEAYVALLDCRLMAFGFLRVLLGMLLVSLEVRHRWQRRWPGGFIFSSTQPTVNGATIEMNHFKLN